MTDYPKQGSVNDAGAHPPRNFPPMDIRSHAQKTTRDPNDWGSRGTPYTPGELAGTSKQAIY